MTRMHAPRVAVVGAGLTGLTAAYALQKAGLDVQVLEREAEVGGRTRTLRRDGFVFDVGAITMLPTYDRVRAHAAELDLTAHLHRVQPVIGIPRQGRIHRLDIARPLQAMLRTELLPLRSKLRMIKLLRPLMRAWNRVDYVSLSALAEWDRESVADYVCRELGEDVHEYIAGPIIRGNTLNSTHAAPFGELLWMLRQYAQPYIYAFDQGINLLAETLATRVPVALQTPVQSVVQENGAVTVCSNREGLDVVERFDACVVAVPPGGLQQLVPDLDPRQRGFLDALKPLPSINVHLGIGGPLQRSETFILPPESEQPDLTTIVLDHLKAPGRVPDGKSMVSLFCRDTWSHAHLQVGDDAIVESVLRMAEPFIGDLRGRVETAVVQRWPYSIIKSEVGLYHAMADYEATLDAGSRLQTGSDFLSLGMEAAVRSGERMAANLLRVLR
jgi:protoporphyrinogen/coproporphyrinogen III oxidase